jgi:hypothetical protein
MATGALPARQIVGQALEPFNDWRAAQAWFRATAVTASMPARWTLGTLSDPGSIASPTAPRFWAWMGDHRASQATEGRCRRRVQGVSRLLRDREGASARVPVVRVSFRSSASPERADDQAADDPTFALTEPAQRDRGNEWQHGRTRGGGFRRPDRSEVIQAQFHGSSARWPRIVPEIGDAAARSISIHVMRRREYWRSRSSQDSHKTSGR